MPIVQARKAARAGDISMASNQENGGMHRRVLTRRTMRSGLHDCRAGLGFNKVLNFAEPKRDGNTGVRKLHGETLHDGNGLHRAAAKVGLDRIGRGLLRSALAAAPAYRPAPALASALGIVAKGQARRNRNNLPTRCEKQN